MKFRMAQFLIGVEHPDEPIFFIHTPLCCQWALSLEDAIAVARAFEKQGETPAETFEGRPVMTADDGAETAV
jgi:hypothetical protein